MSTTKQSTPLSVQALVLHLRGERPEATSIGFKFQNGKPIASFFGGLAAVTVPAHSPLVMGSEDNVDHVRYSASELATEMGIANHDPNQGYSVFLQEGPATQKQVSDGE